MPETTVAPEITLADLLATRAVIVESGWGQGGWCKGSPDGYEDRDFCLGGALAWAISGGRIHSLIALYCEWHDRALAATGILGFISDGAMLRWNDNDNRTIVDVFDRIDAAIALLQNGAPDA